VYVTGLPFDATVDEVAELFSRKCGVIAEEIDSGRPRVKLYTDPATGRSKGDALIVFFKPQSVDMALMLLDDTDFRISPNGVGSGKMRVQPADATYKKTTYEGSNGNEGGGDADSASGTRGKEDARKQRQDKQRIIKKTQKLDAKLADWSDEEDGAAAQYDRNAKWDKVVILKHMFTLRELEEDPAALLDIKEDIRDECVKLGEVTNVVLYDLEEDGVVSVKFRNADAAAACVRVMGGRAFDGRVVTAELASGRERFQKSKKNDGDDDGEGEKEEEN
jgi:HIV Tat-specific factor 1